MDTFKIGAKFAYLFGCTQIVQIAAHMGPIARIDAEPITLRTTTNQSKRSKLNPHPQQHSRNYRL